MLPSSANPTGTEQKPSDDQANKSPVIQLPKGGGAIRGMGEKFAANPVTGTGSLSLPLPASPSRSGFGPQLVLSYDSGSGNGPFGFGWSLALPSITRKTDKGLPRYDDAYESDVYLLSGTEDLVPVLRPDGTRWTDETTVPGFIIQRYRPRIEGLYARIERWTNQATGRIHWRSISRDNITTIYGLENDSCICDPAEPDPANPKRIFSWLICASYDDQGNAILYRYAAENDDAVDHALASERNRLRAANRYLKRVLYGNRQPNREDPWRPSNPALLPATTWMFEVVLDYEEGHYTEDAPDADRQIFAHAQASSQPGVTWPIRQDPFSTYRAGYEVRTNRLCRRVLMFHHFPQELGIADCLVRSTEFSYAESPVASFITAVTQSGYTRRPLDGQPNRYLKKSLPPLEFEYSPFPSAADLAQRPVCDVDPASLENLPAGLDGAGYQWVDLDGEGASGILTEQAGGWFYKRNLSANNRVGEDGSAETVARFGPVEPVAQKPNDSLRRGGQFLDLAGDGQLDLVQMESPARGFYERTPDGGWAPFLPFTSWPGLDVRDPNIRFVDLTGDGHADILITQGDMLEWHPSLAEQGFGEAARVFLPADGERGPRLVFADSEQSVFLADLSGDGLSDLVRIRNGEVSYWPNLGYGRFGPRVTMDNAPRFDSQEQFDQRRIRLADIDGSGTTDIIYLRRDGARVYFNQSGNGWSDGAALPQFPLPDSIVSVQTLDLLGNGTACLVWSSPLPGVGGRTMRYIALIEDKPHLLIGMKNNLGTETRVEYAPSTRFYQADKAAGRPWITRLPFPVHVVERVETIDRISRNVFVTRYTYHHGYFDGVEREFRGFGMVEQYDTETFAALAGSSSLPNPTNLDAASQVPPVLTKTWFHTGAFFDRDHISNFFAGLLDAQDTGEYYREPGAGGGPDDDAHARNLLLPDSVLPDGLNADEQREACRALKGTMLRQEIYALDGTEREPRPYSVSEQNMTVVQLQPQAGSRPGVYTVHPREALTYQYERLLVPVLNGQVVEEATAAAHPETQRLPDPRVQHALTLEVDGFGNVLKSAAVGYGRRFADARLAPADQAKQTQVLVTYTESAVTNPIDAADDYRTPLPVETRAYELTGYAPTGPAGRFQASDLVAPDPHHTGRVTLLMDGEIQYEQQPTTGRQLRLIDQARTLYRKDDLSALLPTGELETLALPGESYKLAFTPGLLAQAFRRDGQPLLPDPPGVLGARGGEGGGYVDLDGDGRWWIPTGQVFYSPNRGDPAAAELAFARAHFFLPHRFRGPFDTDAVPTESSVAYDTHILLVVDTRDPLGNRVSVGQRRADGSLDPNIPGSDYRVLQPRLVTDANRNRAAVVFDALGQVVGTAVMGKPEENLGDSLDGFEPDLPEAVVLAHLGAPIPDPQNPASQPDPHDILRSASTRLVYDLFAYYRSKDTAEPQPAAVYTLARETHAADPGGAQTKIQHSFSYSDGFGREIQKKIQAEPGPVRLRDSSGGIVIGPDGQPQMTTAPVSPRWVGSGWTVFNNKGKPVRQYELFFSDTQRFEFDVRAGVSPVLFYDPAGRGVATLHPNHTWEKVVFDAWRNETWDVNDTVLDDPRANLDVGDFFRRLPDGESQPTWFAQRQGGGLGTQEQAAANKAALHARTPGIAHFDSLGRPFLTIAHNRFQKEQPGGGTQTVEEQYLTRVDLDIEGNQRAVTDALERIVMRYDFDLLGKRIHQASMEAGERWLLADAASNPLYAWDSRVHQLRTVYDALRRPVEGRLRTGAAPEQVTGKTTYGESQPNPEAHNLRGKVIEAHDPAGVITSADYDFKGNLLSSTRRLVQDYRSTPDWSGSVALEAETFTSRTRFDAFNRPVQSIAPHSDRPGVKVNIVEPVYNEANLLEQVHAWLEQDAEPAGLLDPTTASLHAVTNIDYDAKGMRELIEYGNGTSTTYVYDPQTFRLIHLTTRRASDGAVLQDLSYTYDPVGNITHIRDGAQQTIFFHNAVVEPSADYTYDAIYRLVAATGREHLGQVGGKPIPHSYNDTPRVGIDWSQNDGQAMGAYLESYIYDAVGNFQSMRHAGSSAASTSWTRQYTYNEPSLLEPGRMSNRLSSTQVGNGTTFPPEQYAYDAHGNMIQMPQLQIMQWDYRDQLQMTQRQAVSSEDADGQQHQGERTWYIYDAGGQRARKVTDRQAPAGQQPKRKQERIYLGGFEIYREYDPVAGSVTLERETLHIMDDKQRVAMIEIRTVDTANSDPAPSRLVRYQHGNHLGSASLELDDQAQIISYEEYSPYGSTTYQAVRSGLEKNPKRYRYTGMERDEESGLNYHTARYYASWSGRWVSVDPNGLVDGFDLYCYVRGNPIKLVDPSGTQGDDDFTFTAGEYRRVKFQCHIDEVDAVKGDLAGGVAGSPSDPANKQLLDAFTNSVSKKNFVSTAPSNPRPNVSIANSPNEAADRILTGHFNEVDELSALADDAAANTRPGLRTNSALRSRIANDPVVGGALQSRGVDPSNLTPFNPAGVEQFPSGQSVHLSPADADLDPVTGRVVPGPNTNDALARREAKLTLQSTTRGQVDPEENIGGPNEGFEGALNLSGNQSVMDLGLQSSLLDQRELPQLSGEHPPIDFYGDDELTQGAFGVAHLFQCIITQNCTPFATDIGACVRSGTCRGAFIHAATGGMPATSFTVGGGLRRFVSSPMDSYRKLNGHTFP